MKTSVTFDKNIVASVGEKYKNISQHVRYFILLYYTIATLPSHVVQVNLQGAAMCISQMLSSSAMYSLVPRMPGYDM